MFVDLVVCTHDDDETSKLYLFQAPAWSRLKYGDRVIVDTRHGKSRATVQTAITMEQGSEPFKGMVLIAGATLPLRKVLGKYEFFDFAYDTDS